MLVSLNQPKGSCALRGRRNIAKQGGSVRLIKMLWVGGRGWMFLTVRAVLLYRVVLYRTLWLLLYCQLTVASHCSGVA